MADVALDRVLGRIRLLATGRGLLERADGELLRAFCEAHDEPAFEEIVRRHGPMVLAVCRRSLDSLDDAEDAFQATFLLLLRREPSLSRGTSLAAWLHGAARRVAADARRAAARRRRHERQAAPGQTPGPAENAALREVCRILEEEIGHLPTTCGEPFVLCCLEQLSCAEAAARLGLAEGTVRNRLTSARTILRERLARRGVSLNAAFAVAALAGRGACAVSAPLLGSALKAAAQFITGGTLPDGPVAALVDGGCRALVPPTLKLLPVIVLVLGAALLAVAGHQEARNPDDPRVPPPAVARASDQPGEKPAVDRHGDLLPPGVLARLGTVRFRHPGGSRGLVYSRDGQMLVAGGEGKVVRVFDPATGRLRREIHLGTFTATGFALSPDGTRIAVGGFHLEKEDQPAIHGVRIISVQAGTVQRALTRKEGMDHCALAFTPDGKHLTSIGQDGVLRIEAVSTGTELLREQVRVRYPRLAISADGTCLAVCGSDSRAVSVWDWQSGNPARQITVPPRGASALSFRPDGKVLATADEHQKGIRLWDVATGRLLGTVGAGVESAASRVSFSPDGRFLASTHHRRKEVIFWDPATGKQLRHIRVPTPPLGDLAWSGDSRRVALLDQGGIRVWEATTGKEAALPDGHWRRLSLVALRPDGAAVTVGDDGEARLWDLRTCKPLRTVRVADDWVASSAISPDGRWLATSTLGEDHAVCLWEVGSGKRIHRHAGHGPHGGNRTTAFSGDGRRLLSWGDDAYLRIWDVRTGKRVAEHAIRPDGAAVPDLSDSGERRRRMGEWGMSRFSPDGGLLVLTGRDVFYVFDTKSGRQLRKIAHDRWSVEGMAVSPNGRLLLTNVQGRSRDIPLPDGRVRTVAGKGAILLHDLTTGKLVRELPHTLRVPGPVAFSADGRLFAACAWENEGRIAFHDTATGTLRSAIDKIPGRIWALGLSHDGKHVIAGMDDSTALLWAVPGPAGTARAFLAGMAAAAPPARGVPGVAELIDQLGDDDREVRERARKALEAMGEGVVPALEQAVKRHKDVDVRLRAVVVAAAIHRKVYGETDTFVGHTQGVTAVAVSPDGKRMVSASQFDDCPRVWDMRTGKELFQLKEHRRNVATVAWSKDDRLILTGGFDRELMLWDTRTGKRQKTITGHLDFVYGIAFTPDGKKAVSCSKDRTVRVWDLQTGRQAAINTDHPVAVRAVAVTPDGKHAVTACFDGGVRLLEVETGKLVRKMDAAHTEAWFVAVSPDGKRAASVGQDKQVVLHHLHTGKRVRRFEGHTESTHAIAFSSDGKRLFSGALDCTARLWDIESGKEIGRFAHPGTVTCAAVLPGGRLGVTSCNDRTLRLWLFPR